MNKSLEALDKLCDLATPDGDCLNYVIGLAMNIKQDLERLESIEKENEELKIENEAYIEQGTYVINLLNKFKKAIEILKNKPYVLTIGFKEFQWREEENSYVYVEEKWIDTYDYNYDDELIESVDLIHEHYYLTKEEYELLKEVLENE